MSFGENLINLRRQKGWSQDDLANNLNISRQAISKWENNTSKPDVDNIEKISKIFSVKIDELLNNELPNDKAVALDVKKEEKKEKTITIVKLMIIAVIILYAISVIYKFASLLVIVNGVQKYANLNNYHYVITTYDENGLAEKEECWFKDGVSKTDNIRYEEGEIIEENSTYLNYVENYGYIKNSEDSNKADIDYDNYIIFHKGYEKGGQLMANLPLELKSWNINNVFTEAINLKTLETNRKNKKIFLCSKYSGIVLDEQTLLPICMYSIAEKDGETLKYLYYQIDINSVEEVLV